MAEVSILVIEYSDPYIPVLRKILNDLGADFIAEDCFGLRLEGITRMHPSGIILSAGMCDLYNSGIMSDVVKYCWDRTPILGICLGHQVLGSLFGGGFYGLSSSLEGFWDKVCHNGEGIFRNIKIPLNVWRSHTLALSARSILEPMRTTAFSLGGVVMGIRHSGYPLYGVQFHPLEGDGILENFLEVCNRW